MRLGGCLGLGLLDWGVTPSEVIEGLDDNSIVFNKAAVVPREPHERPQLF